jgi:hypothetical protein
MFQTNQGPSDPAHLFLFAGTSAPSAADDADGIFGGDNPYHNNATVGCVSDAGLLGRHHQTAGSIWHSHFPLFRAQHD